jgi:tRNA-dihydrouridine synthase A
MTWHSHTFCVAPMIDWTDRHCRMFHRSLSRRARLYTEMIAAAAVLHGDRERLLAFDPAERPLALQLGGADPRELARAARIGEDFGYDEINLNVGCPSDKVQSGRFGACLMASPELVAECVAAMSAAVRIPVTVKHRLGIDDQDTEETLERFVTTVASGGCRLFIVHARKAWLHGLDPKQNREIPPLDHPRVHRLGRDHPELDVVLNGGIGSLAQAEPHLAHVDGVMLGRAAYQTPWLLSHVDHRFFGAENTVANRHEAVSGFLPYMERQLAEGVPLHHMTRHMLGLFHGQPGARRWRRQLSENAHRAGAGIDIVRAAQALVAAS